MITGNPYCVEAASAAVAAIVAGAPTVPFNQQPGGAPQQAGAYTRPLSGSTLALSVG
jgi:hypothetical protein